MRSLSAAWLVLLGCGSASSPSTPAPPTVAPDEVATPTETAPAQQGPTAPPNGSTTQRTSGSQQAVTPPSPTSGKRATFPETCKAIASDLEKLRPEFPQLTSYRAVDQTSECRIRHSHKMGTRPRGGAGWRGGLGDPEPDGMYLYIGIWDPNGTEITQLDTQPMTGNWWIGSRRVTFLLLEGDQIARSARSAIHSVLERHGMHQRH